MNLSVWSALVSALWLSIAGFVRHPRPIQPAAVTSHAPRTVAAASPPARAAFNKALRFNVYSFFVRSADSGAVRDVQVKAYRGSLLLANFRVRIDGAVTGADVADLDNNRFPELYVYSASLGGDAYGRVYGWQFLPERKAEVTLVNWRLATVGGYKGHDSLWVERNILCRQYPLYDSGPTGAVRMMRYRLRPVGEGFALVADQEK